MAVTPPRDASATPLAHGLYIVPTPLGNASDITLRALQVLKQADLIACEDTRTTARLLNIHGISAGKRLHRYDDHQGARQRPVLMQALQEGKSVALCSDAGTPLIADPGYKLAVAVRAANIPIIPLPGACAATVALCASGLPSDRFYFAGFLPQKQTERLSFLRALAGMGCTCICYETAPRLLNSLHAIRDVFGPEHPVAIGRELTKLHEDIRQESAQALLDHYSAQERIRGEIVLLIGPSSAAPTTETQLNELLRSALEKCSLKEAVAEVTAKTGLARKEVYAAALALQQGGKPA